MQPAKKFNDDSVGLEQQSSIQARSLVVDAENFFKRHFMLLRRVFFRRRIIVSE